MTGVIKQVSDTLVPVTFMEEKVKPQETESEPRMHKVSINKKVRTVVLVVVFSALSLVAGYLLGKKGFTASGENFPDISINRQVPADKQNIDFSMFWKVWDTMETSYYDKSKLDTSKMVLGAIKGMVASIGDPYTIFLTPDENKVTTEDLNGNFEGIGIQIGFRGSQLAVISPLKGSPAEAAGLKPGDIIAGIKDDAKGIERGTVGITLPEAVQIIRGEAGTKVTLSILREGEDKPIITDIVRKAIDVPSVILTYVGDNEDIADIQVLRFGGETKSQWDDAVLDILKKEDLKGVIVDVRNNPGGYLQGAIDLGSEFLDNGKVVVIEENGDGSQDEFYVERLGRLTKDKVVVLINGGSASASEIFAGALRDNKHTPLVGEKSFGKGTIQDAKQLENGTGLHITIAKWLTPDGTWVHEKGLEPDVAVEDDPNTPQDEQLNAAIKALQEEPTASI